MLAAERRAWVGATALQGERVALVQDAFGGVAEPGGGGSGGMAAATDVDVGGPLIAGPAGSVKVAKTMFTRSSGQGGLASSSIGQALASEAGVGCQKVRVGGAPIASITASMCCVSRKRCAKTQRTQAQQRRAVVDQIGFLRHPER